MATAVKKAAHPTSNAKLAQKVEDLDKRLAALEEVIDTAKAKQQREAAAKLAQNPEQLKQLQELIELAKVAKT